MVASNASTSSFFDFLLYGILRCLAHALSSRSCDQMQSAGTVIILCQCTQQEKAAVLVRTLNERSSLAVLGMSGTMSLVSTLLGSFPRRASSMMRNNSNFGRDLVFFKPMLCA